MRTRQHAPDSTPPHYIDASSSSPLTTSFPSRSLAAAARVSVNPRRDAQTNSLHAPPAAVAESVEPASLPHVVQMSAPGADVRTSMAAQAPNGLTQNSSSGSAGGSETDLKVLAHMPSTPSASGGLRIMFKVRAWVSGRLTGPMQCLERAEACPCPQWTCCAGARHARIEASTTPSRPALRACLLSAASFLP